MFHTSMLLGWPLSLSAQRSGPTYQPLSSSPPHEKKRPHSIVRP
ncbi:hypothetical protein [Rubritalea tangerina]